MDLSAVVAGMEPSLREIIGANITLHMNLEREGLWVNADPAQIEQVVINLVTNARDAMPQGGTITVDAAGVNVGPDLLMRLYREAEAFDMWGPASGPPSEAKSRVRVSEGNYVRLLVRDTGIGIDAHTKHFVFAPFFTTKAVGKGVGLGLSAAFGIVVQSGGWISLESELGRGATFEVYLPEIHHPSASVRI
jgi:two-component system, cell cycle sensor histidine kinase and response regulator CckA